MGKMASKNIFLIGFMASGKSTVGRRLARLLERPFVDTDAVIERAARRSVRRIFAQRGEEVFRRLEERAVVRASRVRGAVVAVGGGAVLRAANVRRMRASGIVVYLAVALDRLWSRLDCHGVARRPLLRGGDARRVMARLLSSRRPLYRKAAHLTVRASSSAEQIAGRILTRLGGG
jgi:shikimate kinase